MQLLLSILVVEWLVRRTAKSVDRRSTHFEAWASRSWVLVGSLMDISQHGEVSAVVGGLSLILHLSLGSL